MRTPFHMLCPLLIVTSLALAGCTTLLPGAPQAPAPKSFDLAQDEIADLDFVLDLPASIEPAATTQTLIVTPDAASGQPVTVQLVLADAGDIAESLPPPASGHTYYFFTPGPDQAPALAAMRKSVLAIPGANASLTLRPALCTRGPIGPAKGVVSILLVRADGVMLSPLLATVPLTSLEAPPGFPVLVACTR